MKLKKIKYTENLTFYTADNSEKNEIPYYLSGVSAGFPSPAEDYVDLKLDLNQHLIKHPAATFYVRVSGNSMIDANIHDGDLLIVDRALEPANNCIAVCVIDGDFTVKRIQITNKTIYLLPENPDYPPIEVTESNDFEVWGVVSYVIHKA